MLTDLTTTVRPLKEQDAAHGNSSAMLLQVSRRLDWRFLLPAPDLRQVAYVGSGQGALVESLRLLSDRLIVIKMSTKGHPPAGPYDLVVASNPSREELQGAAKWVAPGGFLYVEAHGLSWLARQWRRAGRQLRQNGLLLHHAGGYFSLLGRLGFHEVQAHWHWPDFESCTRIIPLDDQGAVNYTLAMGSKRIMAAITAVFGRGLLHSGLLPWLVPCFSVVAQRDTA